MPDRPDLVGPTLRYTNAKARDVQRGVDVLAAEYNDDLHALLVHRAELVEYIEALEGSLVSLTEAARDVLAKADKSSIIHSSFGPAFEALRRALPDTEIPDA